MKRLLALAALAATLPFGASAQTPAAARNVALVFEQAAYVTCRQAHALPVDARRELAVFLAEHSARFHGVMIPEDDRGVQLALLVRGGCTLMPEAQLFSVVDKAIVAEMSKLPKRQ